MKQPRRQAGAALLAALLTVALVATLAAAGLWQQWRAIEVESAERMRSQAGWVLRGALDWGRLILREDARAGGVDHLGEPWALPLQEARLGSFLAAQRGVSTDGAAVDEAFLSGEIVDLQARLNINNLVEGGKLSERGVRSFRRLFELLGLSGAELEAMANNLQRAQDPQAATLGAPLPPQQPEQLGWLGLSPASVAALQPYVTVLPGATPVNLNTASPQVLFAILPGISLADAQRLVTARQSAHFRTVSDALRQLGDNDAQPADGLVSVASRFFEIHGRLRLDATIVEERSIVQRDGLEVKPLQRERGVRRNEAR